MDLSLQLLSSFLLVITLAKTGVKKAQLIEFVKVSLLVCRAGGKKGEGSDR